MSQVIDRSAERILFWVGIGAITIWLLPKVISNVGGSVIKSITDIADNIGESVGDFAYDTFNPESPQQYSLPQNPQQARIMIANSPENFALSEVVKAVNNLENVDLISITDSRISRVAPFILNNPNFFSKAQVNAASEALTGYSS